MMIQGNPASRYYVQTGRRDGQPSMLRLREAIPDREKPHDPGKDSHEGPIVIEGQAPEFWAEINKAGFAWIQVAFKRFWVFNEVLAEKSRAGV